MPEAVLGAGDAAKNKTDRVPAPVNPQESDALVQLPPPTLHQMGMSFPTLNSASIIHAALLYPILYCLLRKVTLNQGKTLTYFLFHQSTTRHV